MWDPEGSFQVWVTSDKLLTHTWSFLCHCEHYTFENFNPYSPSSFIQTILQKTLIQPEIELIKQNYNYIGYRNLSCIDCRRFGSMASNCRLEVVVRRQIELLSYHVPSFPEADR